MRAVVTGSSGFIGSALVKRLLEEGWDVVSVDRESGNDILDTHEMSKVIFHADAVFHQAAANLVNSRSAMIEDAVTNAVGTLNILKIAVTHNVPVIMASTGSVIGANGVPGTPYGISKRAGEQYAEWFIKYKKAKITILRYYSVYGPGMPTKDRGVIGIWLKAASKGDTLFVEGGGQSRSFCYIDDIIDANMAVWNTPMYGIVEVGTHVPIQMAQLAELIQRRYNALNVKFVEEREGDDFRSEPDTSRIESVGWSPKVTLDEGLDRTHQWLLSC